MEKTSDVVIVGAGPAGLTAALYTGRGNLSTIIVEKMGPGGELLNTELIEDYPGFKSITGHEMAQVFEEQALEFGATIEYGTVTEIYSEGKEKVVKTDEGDVYRAKAVIVCSGGTPRKLGVPGEAELAGRGVSYCAICDGAFFRDQVLAVVGGGDAAVEEATFLTRYASKVLLIHRRDKLRAERVLQERLFASEKIEVIWDSVVEEIGGEGKVQHIKTRNVVDGSEKRIDIGGIFVYIGFDPTSNIFREPVEKDDMGFVITDDKMETSQPGIFAAGDVRHQFVRQITNATGDATTAAIAVTRLLESLADEERTAAVDPGLKATAGQYP
jgi:thioredoxin reductase (NADPH)